MFNDNTIFCRIVLFALAREDLKPLGLGVFKDSQVWAHPADRNGRRWCEFWGPSIDGKTFYHADYYSNAYEGRSAGWTAYLGKIGVEGYNSY